MGKILTPAAGIVTVEKLKAFLFMEMYKMSVSWHAESSGT